MEPVLWALALALTVVGLVGVAIPGLPGAPLVFLGVLVAAWIDRFQRIGFAVLGLAFALLLLSLLADYAATVLGAKRLGGSNWGALGAMVGLVGGLFLGGLLGLVLGPAIGAVLFEIALARKELDAALRAGVGTFLGFLVGTLVKGLLAVLMVAVAVAAYLV